MERFAGFTPDELESFWIDVQREGQMIMDGGCGERDCWDGYEKILVDRIAEALVKRGLRGICINGHVVEAIPCDCDDPDCTGHLRISIMPCVVTQGVGE